MWLDQVSLVAESDVTLAEALDAAERVFTASPGWGGHTTSVASQGNDLAWVGVAGSTAWLETTVTGPALVESAWRIRGVGADLNVQVDGQIAAWGHGFTFSENMAQAQVVVPAGVHTVRWEAVPYYYAPADMLLMLDAVRVSPASPAQLGTALDGAGLTWTTGGDVSWQGSPASYAHDGADMACSPALAEGQTSWL
jgi:hypothetical protein